MQTDEQLDIEQELKNRQVQCTVCTHMHLDSCGCCDESDEYND